MFRKPIQFLCLIAAPLLLLGSCARIHEDMPPCEVYLEFIFDYNMEYADSFDPQVSAVDVYVFDSNDRFLFSKRAEAGELIGGNRMSLAGDIGFGKYKVLTVGALSGKFGFADRNSIDCVPGVTRLIDVRLALKRTSEEHSEEFPHLWFCREAVEVDYSPYDKEHKVWPVYLIRNTNKFTFVLEQSGGSGTRDLTEAPYTFEVETPEGAVYSWANEPTEIGEKVTYLPYSLVPGESAGDLAVGRLNTCRLFNDPALKYKLIIRSTATSKVLWEYDLIKLLGYLKPDYRPDGSVLPLQEFLDRKGDWHVVILNNGQGIEDGDGAFLALGIRVGNWIMWFNDIGV